ncbi:MAG: hypothetical protein CMM46_06415 [Rhodospirillaceae bacterium]|nr:hypothetical protein [Rhodospirillaceae bacterium]|tara:strand:- start:1310 stop:1498 length:189 start_codon:yes stop_codon:yes gene_type:complete
MSSIRARQLVIEIDGGQHAVQTKQDAKRAGWLSSVGNRVLRFWNLDVFDNPDAVCDTILAEL